MCGVGSLRGRKSKMRTRSTLAKLSHDLWTTKQSSDMSPLHWNVNACTLACYVRYGKSGRHRILFLHVLRTFFPGLRCAISGLFPPDNRFWSLAGPSFIFETFSSSILYEVVDFRALCKSYVLFKQDAKLSQTCSLLSGTFSF